jgi:hypothetical protein
MADDACSSSFQNGLGCRRWSLVVLLSPDEVPRSRNEYETGKYNTRVVHSLDGNGKVGGHAEQWDDQNRPD